VQGVKVGAVVCAPAGVHRTVRTVRTVRAPELKIVLLIGSTIAPSF
jgi:hypothetical protein